MSIDGEPVHCLVVTDLRRQEMLAQAEKLSALGQLAGGVAHDFNNIVQGVAGCASIIGRYASDPVKVKKYAQMMEDAAWRGASITRRLLAMARQDALQTEAVEVPRLLEDLRSMLSHTLGANIDIRLDLGQKLPPALADKGQLEAVLVNLAANSRDAMQDGGVIVISAETETVAAGTTCRRASSRDPIFVWRSPTTALAWTRPCSSARSSLFSPPRGQEKARASVFRWRAASPSNPEARLPSPANRGAGPR